MARAQDHRQDENTHNPAQHFQSKERSRWGQAVCFLEAGDKKSIFLKGPSTPVPPVVWKQERHPNGPRLGSSPGAMLGKETGLPPSAPCPPQWGGADRRVPVSCPFYRWRRNQGGAICRKSIKKMLEVLVVKHSLSEHWALPGVSHASCLSRASVPPSVPPNDGTPAPTVPALGSSGLCPWC